MSAHLVDRADTGTRARTQWFLSRSERANRATRLDDVHPGEQAWSEGNRVRPLIHGAAYFAELHERIEAARPGDLIFFTDWQGDADERLTGEPGSEVVNVLARADERGVDVRGLIWRSHMAKLKFSARANRTLGQHLQDRGAEALLDMRVRVGGSHHQKFVVIRHAGAPERDIAYVGGIDLCHTRRDDADHLGDPQGDPIAREYGATPPWHDLQAAIEGPAVYDVETVFRERWEDPTPLTRNPVLWAQDRLLRLDVSPDPLPPQQPPPPPVAGAAHAVQLLRTYPDLRAGRDYEFAKGGERSVARGYLKALSMARDLIYIEDQYLWGHGVADPFVAALQANPRLHLVAVLPRFPDRTGLLGRTPQLLGRRRAIQEIVDAAPDRVGVFGIENRHGTPVYVHAKTCVVDDQWATIGSDNFNRRSWTHDSELTAAVVDLAPGDHSRFARDLRLTLAAEHLDRPCDGDLHATMADCVDAAGLLAAYRACSDRLQEWYDGGRVGPRPPGRLRPLHVPELGRATQGWAKLPYHLLDDPDGRPRHLRRGRRY